MLSSAESYQQPFQASRSCTFAEGMRCATATVHGHVTPSVQYCTSQQVQTSACQQQYLCKSTDQRGPISGLTGTRTPGAAGDLPNTTLRACHMPLPMTQPCHMILWGMLLSASISRHTVATNVYCQRCCKSYRAFIASLLVAIGASM
jgi:hypothetical protein